MMHKFTGPELLEMRGYVALCQDYPALFVGEKPFIKEMAKKADRMAMVLTQKQYDWLLLIIDRVITFNDRQRS